METITLERVTLGEFIEEASRLLDEVNGPQKLGERIDEVAPASTGLFLIRDQHNSCIGCASLLFPMWNNIGIILHFAIAPKYRRQKAGLSAIAKIRRFAEDHHLSRIAVVTAEHASEAVSFWLACGFIKRTIDLPSYLGEGTTTIWLDFSLF